MKTSRSSILSQVDKNKSYKVEITNNSEHWHAAIFLLSPNSKLELKFKAIKRFRWNWKQNSSFSLPGLQWWRNHATVKQQLVLFPRWYVIHVTYTVCFSAIVLLCSFVSLEAPRSAATACFTQILSIQPRDNLNCQIIFPNTF